MRKCRLFFLGVAVFLIGASAAFADEWADVQAIVGKSQGVSTMPAQGIVTTKYSTGALMGNGDIGVIAGDQVDRQVFYFGKSDFWGTHYRTRVEPSILSLGGITITCAQASRDPKSVYRMVQDVLHAEVRSTMRFGNSLVEMRSFTADKDNVFVTEFTLGANEPAVTLDVDLWMPPVKDPAGGDMEHPFTVGEAASAPGVLFATRAGDVVNVPEWSSIGGFQSRGAIGVSIIGGKFSGILKEDGAIGGSFTLAPGKTVRIAAVFRTDSRIGSDGPTVEALRDKAVADARALSDADVDALAADHQEWWKQFWLKSYVELNDKTLDDFYYGALYALGCCCREGKLCAPMFGAWMTGDDTAWGGRYFNNYNIEAVFYGVCSSNRPEMALPYAELVFNERPYMMNRTARAGYAGICSQRTYTPFEMFAKEPPQLEPIAAVKDYKKLPTDQKSNATFTALPAMWYWEYTHDDKYLREELYPELKGLDAFWRDFMTWDETKKCWIIDHSAAHEEPQPWDTNVNLDLGFCRKVERLLLQTSAELNVDADLRPKWQDVLDHLTPYPTGMEQGKEVFYMAEKRGAPRGRLFQPGDQPINMEGGVFPGENIYLGGDEKLLQIARNSLELMNSWGVTRGGNSNNGFCKEFEVAARVGWPAEDLVKKLQAAIAFGWRPSNLTVFQGGGGIETSGTIEAINSMLMQSEGGVIRVFPVWPTTRDASFTRLRAKGSFLISSEMKNGAVTHIEITTDKGGMVHLINPWPNTPLLQFQAAGQASILSQDGSTLSFATAPGGVYELSPQK